MERFLRRFLGVSERSTWQQCRVETFTDCTIISFKPAPTSVRCAGKVR